MRQAVRRWREWRENRDLINDATRGDGLSTLHGWVANSPQSGDGDGLRQGLTLVHFSAQLEQFLWDRGSVVARVEGVLWGDYGV